MFTVIPSSTGQWLAVTASRVHAGGPDMVLRLMTTVLATSGNVMAAFERIGAAALPAPAHLGSGAIEVKPHLRLVKSEAI